METTKGNELPDKSETAEFPDIVSFLLGGKSCGTPVETRGEVVC